MNLDRHPILDLEGLPVQDQIRHLRERLAQLWDHAWWVGLPDEMRRAYERQGFRDPIEKFYEDR